MAELKIAIAEDNPLMLELLSSILEAEEGFHVVGKADNGEDAYQMAEGTESYADVYDMADLFTDEEEKQLSEQAQVLSDTMKMEAVIVTIEENSDSAQVFADGFYMEGGFGNPVSHRYG